MNCEEDCKHFNDCYIIKTIKLWEEKRQLEIEHTLATWVFSNMWCAQGERKEGAVHEH